jgi:hypothetical protein
MFERSGAPRLTLRVAMLLAGLAGCKARAGDRCVMGRAACTGERAGLFCGADGTYHALACGGHDGCQQWGAMVACDQSIAKEGDRCTSPGLACAPDRRSALSCEGGRFVVAETCSGPAACSIALDDLVCDHDIAAAGDPCRDDGEYACTSDRSSALVCQDQRMVAARACAGPRGCSVTHPRPGKTELDCDAPAAPPPRADGP